MKRKLLSISELADKSLSRNYVMEADIILIIECCLF